MQYLSPNLAQSGLYVDETMVDIECQLELLRRHEALNQLETAESICIQLLRKYPQHDHVLVAAAAMATRRGAAAVAETLLYRALASNPFNSAAYLALGMIRYDQEDLQEAERYFRKALLASPGNSEALRHLGALLNECGRFNDAASLLMQAHQLSPDSALITQSLADALQGTGQSQDAYRLYHRVLEQEPDNVNALISISVVCEHLDRMEEALDHLLHARETAPENAQVYLNLGGILRGMLKIDQALVCYEKALALRPEYQTARWNICQIELLQGNYRKGFHDFDSRFHTSHPVLVRNSGLPTWNGEPVTGKRILVQCEQAYGDTIQFVRYLPLLAEVGATVVLENRLTPLNPLLRSLPGVELITDGTTAGQDCDFTIALLSLPRLLATTLQTIPCAVPYLAPSAQKREHWRNKLRPDQNLNVGICWAGRKAPDPRRTVPAACLSVLAAVSRVNWYSLQINEGGVQGEYPPLTPFIDLTGPIRDFEDSAALVSCLDLVISIDSAVAHLAGGLAIPTWLLLPFAPDWRWMLGHDDSPWYPTMRIFRQSQPGDWDSVLKRTASALEKVVTLQHNQYRT